MPEGESDLLAVNADRPGGNELGGEVGIDLCTPGQGQRREEGRNRCRRPRIIEDVGPAGQQESQSIVRSHTRHITYWLMKISPSSSSTHSTSLIAILHLRDGMGWVGLISMETDSETWNDSWI